MVKVSYQKKTTLNKNYFYTIKNNIIYLNNNLFKVKKLHSLLLITKNLNFSKKPINKLRRSNPFYRLFFLHKSKKRTNKLSLIQTNHSYSRHEPYNSNLALFFKNYFYIVGTLIKLFRFDLI